eukprot:5489692-Prymnesium_polylepis.2
MGRRHTVGTAAPRRSWARSTARAASSQRDALRQSARVGCGCLVRKLRCGAHRRWALLGG